MTGVSRSKFEIFRAKDAPRLMEAECMAIAPISVGRRAGINAVIAAGYPAGCKMAQPPSPKLPATAAP